MSVYLGYNTVTKQYLKSLALGGDLSSGSTTKPVTSGFTMSGDIDMDGNETIGLDDPRTDSSATSKRYMSDNFLSSSGDIDMSGNEITGLGTTSVNTSATNKKYVDDKVVNVGGLTQVQADNRYLKKTDATTMYEMQTSVSNTYLSRTDAASTYTPRRVVDKSRI